jgi:hypothetical protein
MKATSDRGNSAWDSIRSVDQVYQDAIQKQ